MFAMANGGKSIRGNTCAQVFTTDKGFIGVYPIRSKGEVKHALRLFCKEVEVPTAFICDQSGEQTSKEVKEYIGNVGSSLRPLEEGTPWANRAELVIGHLKARVRSTMKDANYTPMFWNYCMEWVARVNNLTAKNIYQLRGETPYTTVYGEEGDISVLGDFNFYEVIYYFDHKVSYPMTRERMGRYLGPSTGVGNEMCSWMLKTNGKVVARRTVRPLNQVETNSEVEQNKIKVFNETISRLYGEYDCIPHEDVKTN